MDTVLITGGAGYIGSHAVKRFLIEGYKVLVIDNLETGYKQVIDTLKPLGSLIFYESDLKNLKATDTVFRDHKINSVIHFAASASVNESMDKPGKYFRNNVCGTLNLLKAMNKYNVKKILFSSTCATYGETQYVPVDEQHPQNPSNPYGESKMMVEKMIKWFGQIHDVRHVILRYFNICGADPEGVVGDSKKPASLLMQCAVRGALGLEPFKLTCPKVDTPDETPIRDYTDVNDLIDAHYKALNYLDKGGKSEIINLGTGKGNSVLELVQKVENTLHVKIDKRKGIERKGEYAKIFASYKKAKKVLDWEPKTRLEESVLSLKKWYEKHPNGWGY
jgi:UDP-glucose 4-epimerase